MTDQELLERAARAAGINLEWDRGCPLEVFPRWSGNPSEPPEQDHRDWNPLDDDGDALRLAVNLGLTVGMHKNRIMIDLGEFGVLDEDGEEAQIDEVYRDIFKGDEWMPENAQRATRRAIVRAAAALTDK